MEEQELKMLIDKVKDKIEKDVNVKKLEYMMDFGSVSVMVNVSYNWIAIRTDYILKEKNRFAFAEKQKYVGLQQTRRWTMFRYLAYS